MQIGDGFGAAVGVVRVGLDAECAGTGGLAADGDVAFAKDGAGIALAVAAFMLGQGWVVAEALFDVLTGGLGGAAEGALIEAAAAFQAAAVAGTDTHAVGAVAAFVAEVFKAETAGGEFVVIFICGRSDGAAFEPDTVGGDVVAAFAGKEAALAADAAAVAAGFALVVVAGYAPCGTEGDLGADAAAALFALLIEGVLRAFDVQCAADFSVDAFGMGLGTVQDGVALAAELQFVGLQQGVLMALAVGAVFAFAVGGFGVDVDAGLGTDGSADADLYAGMAVFAVLMLAVLGRLQPDVACGIKTDAVACLDAAALDGHVAFAAADIDVATGFQAALLALAVVLVLFLAGGFKAETGFDGQQDGALLSVVAFKGVGYFADRIGQLVGLGAGG